MPTVRIACSLSPPYFVLDLRKLRASYKAFQNAFPTTDIYYALKANSDPLILAALAEAGSGFEAASWQEIDQLLNLGVNADRIIYGSAVKPRAYVERAAQAGVDRFAADSLEELQMLGQAAPGARVFVRVKLDDTYSVFQMSGKFGVPQETAAGLLRQAVALGLRPWGLSFNVGSQATRSSEWATGIAAVAPIFTELRAEGIRLEVLNLGGGFPVQYRDSVEIGIDEIAKQVRAAVDLLPYQPLLIAEPGRRIVATCLSLVATIISRIERPDGPWLFLDCGVYNALYEALVHQGRTSYPVSQLDLRSADAPLAFYVLAGPTGDGLDMIARNVALPVDMAVCDRLLFRNVGAYTRAMASSFNGFPVPPVLVQEN